MKLTDDELRRFEKKVNKDGPIPDQSNPHYMGLERCHVWTASLRNAWYGQFNLRKKIWTAPRLSWVISRGEIPHGMHILHKCDNPACVNPSHLFLGTPFDNAVDRTRKGRTASGKFHGSVTKPEAVPKGSTHKNSKLKESDVKEIRDSYARGGETYKSLAKRFGVRAPHIGKILKGQKWGHLPTITPECSDDRTMLGVTQLSKLFGISSPTIERRAIQHGVACKQRGETFGGRKWDLAGAINAVWGDLKPEFKAELMRMFPDAAPWEVMGGQF